MCKESVKVDHDGFSALWEVVSKTCLHQALCFPLPQCIKWMVSPIRASVSPEEVSIYEVQTSLLIVLKGLSLYCQTSPINVVRYSMGWFVILTKWRSVLSLQFCCRTTTVKYSFIIHEKGAYRITKNNHEHIDPLPAHNLEQNVFNCYTK